MARSTITYLSQQLPHTQWEQAGRLYLPTDELAEYGLTEADLDRGQVDERWRASLRCQIERTGTFTMRPIQGYPYDGAHPGGIGRIGFQAEPDICARGVGYG